MPVRTIIVKINIKYNKIMLVTAHILCKSYWEDDQSFDR